MINVAVVSIEILDFSFSLLETTFHRKEMKHSNNKDLIFAFHRVQTPLVSGAGRLESEHEKHKLSRAESKLGRFISSIQKSPTFGQFSFKRSSLCWASEMAQWINETTAKPDAMN